MSDRYEALALVARGGQGAVWRGRDRVHARDVALKVLDGNHTPPAIRPHPGLPVVRDTYMQDGRTVLVMDWIGGVPLDRVRDLPFEEVLALLGEVGAALDHLHDHDPPILHRDVKPANVILTPDGRAVLVDLGLSGSAHGGTPGFAAPERDPSPASDVFGLAATAHVLLTGAVPLPGREPEWTRVPSGSRERIRAALDAALSVDPRARPRSAGTIVASLRPDPPPNNLPAELTSFIGRLAVAAELRSAIAGPGLVTLRGPGGCGKTRLALHVARSALLAFDGVWLAELAGVSEPEMVAHRVAAAVLAQPDRGPGAVASALGTGDQLLILDNCEHLAGACASLVDGLVRACPTLRIVATSREPLRASGERVLAIPAMDDAEAVRLFAERGPSGNADVVARICRRLDGIPLAIELAAARAASAGAEDVDARLHEALHVLTGGARTVPRHETLRATIAWSCGLLSDGERAALFRLSVFAGGFTADAAREVCSVERELVRLTDASLVERGGGRYRMLETIRQYAAEHADRSGELELRHAAWCAAFVDRADRALSGPGEPDALNSMTNEHANIASALARTVDDDPPTAARIATAAFRYWHKRGHWDEGRAWFERIAVHADRLEPKLHGDVLRFEASLAHFQGEPAPDLLETALELYRSVGAMGSVASTLNSLAMEAHDRGELERARALHEEGLEINRRIGSPAGIAISLNNLASVLMALGESDAVPPLLDECLGIARERGDRAAEADHLLNLGSFLVSTDDVPAGRRLLEEALPILSALEDDYTYALALHNLGEAASREGKHDEAVDRFAEAVEIIGRLGRAREIGTFAERLEQAQRRGSGDEVDTDHPQMDRAPEDALAGPQRGDTGDREHLAEPG